MAKQPRCSGPEVVVKHHSEGSKVGADDPSPPRPFRNGRPYGVTDAAS